MMDKSKENESELGKTLTEEHLLEAIRVMNSSELPPYARIALHPFDVADLCIRPEGWFSKLVWRFLRWHYEDLPSYVIVPSSGEEYV